MTHNATAQRRRGAIPYYVPRWFASCTGCAYKQDGNSREQAQMFADDHNDIYGEDPPPRVECACWNAEHLEHEPRDCPIHKGDASNA